jgi:hypothetical protein
MKNFCSWILNKNYQEWVIIDKKRAPGEPEYERNSGNYSFRSYFVLRKGTARVESKILRPGTAR